MANPRQKQTSAAPRKKWDSYHDDEEEDWVVVKKQKVTIIIPPLPEKQPSAMPNTGECGQNRMQVNPSKSKSQLHTEITTSSRFESEDAVSEKSLEERMKNHPSTEQAICSRRISNASEPNLISQKKPSASRHDLGIRILGNTQDKFKKKIIFGNASAYLDRRRRAAYLDRKLKRAGGLENWLASLGLACFNEIFRRRSMSKFQLLNLDMKKLKDMGLEAVGPRRKLMHAIDCLCQLHCFQRRP